MDIGYLLSSLLISVLYTRALSDPMIIHCTAKSCYELYHSSAGQTWTHSYNYCSGLGKQLLRIEDATIQRDVGSLLAKVPNGQQVAAWVAGRGSSDNTWYNMDGAVFNAGNMLQETSGNCLYATIYSHEIRVYSDNCDETQSTAQVVCEYHPQDGRCNQGSSMYGDKCYTRTMYDGSDFYKIDWFGAQAYCHSTGGDLAYTKIDSYWESIYNLLGGGTGFNIWLGVRRRIWRWGSGAGGESLQPMTYFRWAGPDGVHPTFGDISQYDLAVYVDHTNTWRTQNYQHKLNSFICTTSVSPSAAGPMATPSTSTPAGTLGDRGPPPADSSSDDETHEAPDIVMIVVPVVIGVVVVAIIVVVATICVRRKRKKQPRDHQINNQTNRQPQIMTDSDDSAYCEIVLGESEELGDSPGAGYSPDDVTIVDNLTYMPFGETSREDTISPYEEIAQTSKNANQVVKNKYEQNTTKQYKPKLPLKPQNDDWSATTNDETNVAHMCSANGDLYALPNNRR